MEDLRSALAEALRKVATRLQDEAQADAPGEGGSAEGDPVDGASPAADWLNRSADYVEQVDLEGIKRIKSTVDDEVRRHPGRSLLVAGAAGLLLGLLLRRR
jgi:ElaB/YqjD/DUF883 family membrane-anchored ribosome-binding protein